MTSTHEIDFRGQRLVYRTAGQGSAIVLFSRYRRRLSEGALNNALQEQFRVIQVEPLGFGQSDPTPELLPHAIHAEVLAVLDQEGVDRFVPWGFSQGAAMAASVAQAAPARVAAVVCGGLTPLGRLTDAMLRRNRDPGAVAFWLWYRRFDWPLELGTMTCPRLLYAGSEDHPHVDGLRRVRPLLSGRGADFLEFPGLNHHSCGQPRVLAATIVPAVLQWLARRVGQTW